MNLVSNDKTGLPRRTHNVFRTINIKHNDHFVLGFRFEYGMNPIFELYVPL